MSQSFASQQAKLRGLVPQGRSVPAAVHSPGLVGGGSRHPAKEVCSASEVPACPPQAYASWFPAQALKPNRSLEFPFGDSRWRRFPDEMVNWGMLSTLWLNPKPMAMS